MGGILEDGTCTTDENLSGVASLWAVLFTKPMFFVPLLRFTALWLIAASLLQARVIPPSEKFPAFRRDRIPLDFATLSDVSRQLVAIAAQTQGADPQQSMQRARAIALALALDPLNEDASKALNQFAKDNAVQTELNPDEISTEDPPKIDPDALWDMIGWLQTPEAGPDGNILASMLRDVTAIARPDHPNAQNNPSAESSVWVNWNLDQIGANPQITEPTSSENTPSDNPAPEDPTAQATADDTQENTAENSEETSAAADPAPPANQLPLTRAELRTVVWKDQKAQVVTLQMQASPSPATKEGEKSPLPLCIGETPENGPLDPQSRLILHLLEADGNPLPKDWIVRVDCPENPSALKSSSEGMVNAAAAVLVRAAITGQEPDGLVLGKIDAAGRFLPPDRLWQTLKRLPSGHGRKLILPNIANGWLESLLAIDMADFFFSYETMLAPSLKALGKLTDRSEPDPNFAAARKQFTEIREVGIQRDIRDYLSNRFVRARLESLAKEAPWHASANLLYLQSAGRRPVKVIRQVFATEMRAAIEIMGPMATDEWIERIANRSGGKTPGRLHDQSREKMDSFSSFGQADDQNLYENARNLAAQLRSIDRYARVRGGESNFGNAIRDQLKNFKLSYQTLHQQLRDIEANSPAGD
ncbi:MAG: hypothetical protein ACO3RV_00375 [Luteolibacter sp.]